MRVYKSYNLVSFVSSYRQLTSQECCQSDDSSRKVCWSIFLAMICELQCAMRRLTTTPQYCKTDLSKLIFYLPQSFWEESRHRDQKRLTTKSFSFPGKLCLSPPSRVFPLATIPAQPCTACRAWRFRPTSCTTPGFVHGVPRNIPHFWTVGLGHTHHVSRRFSFPCKQKLLSSLVAVGRMRIPPPHESRTLQFQRSRAPLPVHGGSAQLRAQRQALYTAFPGRFPIFGP